MCGLMGEGVKAKLVLLAELSSKESFNWFSSAVV